MIVYVRAAKPTRVKMGARRRLRRHVLVPAALVVLSCGLLADGLSATAQGSSWVRYYYHGEG